MPHDEDGVRIAAIVASMIVGPANRLGNVLGNLLDGHAGRKMRVSPHLQVVIDRDEHETLVGERLGLLLHVLLVARMPASSVNPDGNRVIFPLGWGVNVEGLPVPTR